MTFDNLEEYRSQSDGPVIPLVKQFSNLIRKKNGKFEVLIKNCLNGCGATWISFNTLTELKKLCSDEKKGIV